MFERQKENQEEKQEYTASDKAYEEGSKLYYDACKHLTTLNTGSILLLVTFLEKLFNNPHWKMLVAISLCGLILSCILSFMSMTNFAALVRDFGVINPRDLKTTQRIFNWSLLSFLIGIISLVVFALRNFYS